MQTIFFSSLDRLGIEPTRLYFALRTALASFLAILIAHACGLEHPQWAGMTVWACSPQIREHLFERGMWRFLGSISGILVGIALIVLSTNNTLYLVLGLAVWVGLCGAISLLQQGLVAYGTVLAGYSAAMVALLSTSHPDNVWLLGLDRFLTISIGIIIAIGVAYFFTPKIQIHSIQQQLHRLSLQCLQAVLKNIVSPNQANLDHLHYLLRTIALVDEQLDAHAIGSLKSRRKVHKARQLVLAQVNMVVFLQNQPALNASKTFENQLQQWIDAFEAQQPTLNLQLDEIHHDSADLQSLLMTLLHAYQQYFNPQDNDYSTLPTMHLHRNWMGAVHTFVRSFSVLTIVGMLWVVTDWAFMPLMMLGLSVMLSVFVGFENPAWFLRHVTSGQFIGAILAFLCTWTAWHYLAHSSWQMIFWMLPFMLLHTFIYAQKRLMLGAFDTIMVMLILLQPHYPVHISMGQSLANGLAVVMGPIIAMLAFTWIFPPNPQKRLQHLLSMVRFQLRGLCSAKGNDRQLMRQRNRLVHSVLKAQRINDKLPQPDADLSRALLYTLQQAQIILCIHRSIGSISSSSTQRLMRALLQSWQKPQANLEQEARFIHVLKQRLPMQHPLQILFF